ncbi:MAG TPA: exo-beta-N-acetylmuramidase NamZ domain-containing protein [Bacillota bacterium]|nr:exo-beta-N-acetylmuramidase NamZ domain-containing protein [Bacillota bacterium]
MRVLILLLIIMALVAATTGATGSTGGADSFRLGNEVLLARYRHLIDGKRVGLITTFSGVNSRGESLISIFANDPRINLVALFGPEHGVDGTAPAGAAVKSYTHPVLLIPVHSLYGEVRKPTTAMLRGIDVLVFDIQDVGARYYTYISTMNYCMIAARESGIPFVVLDRPNPLGGVIVDGPVLKDPFQSFVGVDVLPMAHGMTNGELAKYFNRLIGADVTVVPMEGYTREMIFQDTGLAWVQTSPNIPAIENCFSYMATGLAEGTSLIQGDKFLWVGGAGLNSEQFAATLNAARLPGVQFIPEQMGSRGGARLIITDYRAFNPARTGIYTMFTARQQWKFSVPRSGTTPASITMFDKIMGGREVGDWLLADYTPEQAISAYQHGLDAFKTERVNYLLYGFAGSTAGPAIVIDGHIVYSDVTPVIQSGRTLVPIRVIAENFGATVDWIESESAVVISQGAKTIRMVLGQTNVTVNGVIQLITDGVAPTALSGRTLVPLRFVAEHLGAEVTWQQSTYTAHIRR